MEDVAKFKKKVESQIERSYMGNVVLFPFLDETFGAILEEMCKYEKATYSKYGRIKNADRNRYILSQYDIVKTSILNNLIDCDGKKEFEKAVKNNKNNLDALIRHSNRQIRNYEYYLRSKSNEINDKLQLNEFQQQKEEFQRNMAEFRQANIKNEIKGNSNEYIMKKSFLFFFEIYDNEKTISEYKNKINQFLRDSEYEYEETLEKNRDQAISKINDLFDTINEGIDNFKGNIKDLRDFIQKLELKIYETIGINDE